MIELIAEAPSTNGALLARLSAGKVIGEGHWLIADRQSAGRGRSGRTWHDGHGNFMGSTVAHLYPGDHPATSLSLVAGVALHRALTGLDLPASPRFVLKWPNDVLVEGAKLAGILLERAGNCVVVGIGVNLADAPKLADRATVALTDLGHGVTRDGFAQKLADAWSDALALWHDHGWPALRQDWLARAHPPGTLLSVHDRDAGLVVGGFAGINPDGAAVLRLADGTQRVIHAGDVELVGCEDGDAAGD